MSEEHKTPTPPEEPHMEKQIMDMPQDEYLADMAQPSVDKSAGGQGPAGKGFVSKESEDKPVAVHSAGHQTDKAEVFEEGVEG